MTFINIITFIQQIHEMKTNIINISTISKFSILFLGGWGGRVNKGSHVDYQELGRQETKQEF